LLSDDLHMQGLQRHCNTALALSRGLAAGLDLLLLGNTLLEEEQVCTALALGLEQALEREPALAGRAREALERVARRKAQFQRGPGTRG
ncbi:MAG TPA: hypothetical protein VL359_16910, partial [bacterium]|nr:hypothetical protein [bacterium]